MNTNTHNDHIIQHQHSMGHNQVDVNENHKQIIYNLGFNNGREEFMSEAQLNMTISSDKKLEHISSIEKNEDIFEFLKSQREHNIRKVTKDILKANKIYEICKNVINDNDTRSHNEFIPFNNNTLEDSVFILNRNMNIDRELIALGIIPYKHLRSYDYQKDSFYYKLGYSLGLYAETLMFYGTLEQKQEGLYIAKSGLDFSTNKLVYVTPNRENIRKGYEKDIDVVIALYEKIQK